MTVSLGVSSLDPADPVTGDEVVHRADVALYAAKNAGGNCVRVWRPGMPAPADDRHDPDEKTP
jgi:PleD family two-component response regulator